jgi:hypothetical protein
VANEAISPPADADAVGIPPAARTTAIEAITSAIPIASATIEATAAAAIEATTAAAAITAAASASASAAARLRRRGRCADENGRRAGHIDEQQS